MNNISKKLWNTVSWVLVVCVAVLAFLLAGIRFIGITPYVVLSGSMEPSFHVGSLVYVKKTPPEKINVGDPITFVLNNDLVLVTHRVVEVDTKNRRFYTKGDANDSADGAPVAFENLVGKAIFNIPNLGYFSNWIKNPPGLYIGISAGIILLVLIILPDLLDKAAEADRKKAEYQSK